MTNNATHTAGNPLAEAQRPLLRGWFHAVAAVAAVVVTVLLTWLSWGDWPKMISLMVFGLTMVMLYTVSAIYHIGTWRPKVRRVLRALDHSNIYIIIAGTYTPLCVNVLSGTWRVSILTLIWLVALAGIVLTVMAAGVGPWKLRLHRWVSTSLYMSTGWVAIVALPEFFQILPWPAIALLFLGGALNTVGAVVYARKRPDPSPRVFGYHEIFHAFVVAGSVAFTLVMWIWVLPFARR